MKRLFFLVFIGSGLLLFSSSGVAIESTSMSTYENFPNANVLMGSADFIGGSVSRAVFTKAVVNREPVDVLHGLGQNVRFIYFFTELKGLTGVTVIHRWEHEGELMFETRFQVGGPRWRIWSSQVIHPTSQGNWKVTVSDAHGRLLQESLLMDEVVH